jgi:hypothetical protein
MPLGLAGKAVTIADSKSLLGGTVLAMISASCVSRQLSFEATTAPLLSCNSKVGSAAFQ